MLAGGGSVATTQQQTLAADEQRQKFTNLFNEVQLQKGNKLDHDPNMQHYFGRKMQYASQEMQRLEGLKHLQEQRTFLHRNKTLNSDTTPELVVH